MSSGAAVCDIPTPIPVRTRAPKKVQWFWVATWIIPPIITRIEPIAMQIRRPRLSAIYEPGMKERKEPSETAAIMRPLVFVPRPPRNLLTIEMNQLAFFLFRCFFWYIDCIVHSGSTRSPLIMLAQYPEVAEADSINPIPRFNFRKPRSLIQFLLVLFCRTTLGCEVSAIISATKVSIKKKLREPYYWSCQARFI